MIYTIDEEEYYDAHTVADLLGVEYGVLLRKSLYINMPYLKIKAKRYYRKSYIDKMIDERRDSHKA